MYIYGLRDPRTKELRYVGVSKNPQKRLSTHKSSKPTTHKGSWITSLRKQGLYPEMVLIAEVEESKWKEAEREYIRFFKELGFRLTNSTEGGDGVLNPSESVRAKIIKAHTGRKITEEHRRRLSESHKGQIAWNKGQSSWAKGKKFTDEHKKKIRETMTGQKHPVDRVEKNRLSHLGKPAWNKGKPFSEESRRRMSEAHKGKIPWNKGLRKNADSLGDASKTTESPPETT